MDTSQEKSPDYSLHLRQIDKMGAIVMGFLISLTLIAIFSRGGLALKEMDIEYVKLSEFLDTHKIFEKYLSQKKDLYWHISKTAHELSGKKQELRAYTPYLDLFGGVSRAWGWDKSRLDERFDYKTVMQDWFLYDFFMWTSETKQNLSKMKPKEQTEYDWHYDMKQRLKRLLIDDPIINDFFAQNFTLKMDFLKDIIRKYKITVPDDFYASTNPKYSQFTSYIAKFFNDFDRSLFMPRHPFYLTGKFDFYETHDSYNAMFNSIFNKFIRNKFTIYDLNIFENKLSYSAYIDEVVRRKSELKGRLQTSPKLRDVQAPLLQVKMDIAFFYQIIFWIFFLVSILLRNILVYRSRIYETIGLKKGNSGILDEREHAGFLSLSVLNFRNKNGLLRIGIPIIQFLLMLILVWICLRHISVIYNDDQIRLWLLAYAPFILSILAYFIKFRWKGIIGWV